MKKTLLVLTFVMLIGISLLSGTLAMYTTSISELAEGSVVAKEFILIEDGTDNFETEVKIAPSETKTWEFAVKNFDDGTITETAMDLDFIVDVVATDGKTAIAPLKVTVTDGDQVVKGTQTGTGTGTIIFGDEFSLNTTGQTKTYTVEIEWPSDDEVDIDYAGSNYGTAINVSVTGTQK